VSKNNVPTPDGKKGKHLGGLGQRETKCKGEAKNGLGPREVLLHKSILTMLRSIKDRVSKKTPGLFHKIFCTPADILTAAALGVVEGETPWQTVASQISMADPGAPKMPSELAQYLAQGHWSWTDPGKLPRGYLCGCAERYEKI